MTLQLLMSKVTVTVAVTVFPTFLPVFFTDPHEAFRPIPVPTAQTSTSEESHYLPILADDIQPSVLQRPQTLSRSNSQSRREFEALSLNEQQIGMLAWFPFVSFAFFSTSTFFTMLCLKIYLLF